MSLEANFGDLMMSCFDEPMLFIITSSNYQIIKSSTYSAAGASVSGASGAVGASGATSSVAVSAPPLAS